MNIYPVEFSGLKGRRHISLRINGRGVFVVSFYGDWEGRAGSEIYVEKLAYIELHQMELIVGDDDGEYDDCFRLRYHLIYLFIVLLSFCFLINI